MPTPRAPQSRAAAMTTRPSPEPRSYTISPGCTPASRSISSTFRRVDGRYGVGTSRTSGSFGGAAGRRDANAYRDRREQRCDELAHSRACHCGCGGISVGAGSAKWRGSHTSVRVALHVCPAAPARAGRTSAVDRVVDDAAIEFVARGSAGCSSFAAKLNLLADELGLLDRNGFAVDCQRAVDFLEHLIQRELEVAARPPRPRTASATCRKLVRAPPSRTPCFFLSRPTGLSGASIVNVTSGGHSPMS